MNDILYADIILHIAVLSTDPNRLIFSNDIEQSGENSTKR